MVYDAVVIGSGLGGFSCASALSREGLNVCLLEQASLPGGLLSSFQREGFTLDVGIHYVGWLYPGQPTARYLSYLGVYDRLTLQSLPTAAFDVVHLPGGEEIAQPIGLNHFSQTLSQRFPDYASSFLEYTHLLSNISSLFSPEQLAQGRLIGKQPLYQGVSYAQWLEQHFASALVQNALVAPLSLCMGGNRATGLYELGVFHSSNIEGAHRFVGGVQRLVDAFVEVLAARGVTLRCNARVESINVDAQGRVKGVTLTDGERIESPRVISAVHPWQTLAMLEQGMEQTLSTLPQYMQKLRKRVSTLTNTMGFCGQWIAIDRKAFPAGFTFSNHYFPSDNPWFADRNRDAAEELSCPFFAVFWQALEPSATHVVAFVIAPLSWYHVQPWQYSSPGERPAGYLELKETIRRNLLARFAEKFPTLAPHARVLCTATPLTFYRYTLRPEGTAYGVMRDFLKPTIDSMLRIHPIPGFYMVQGLNITGFLGTIISALYTCAQIVGEPYLARRILRS